MKVIIAGGRDFNDYDVVCKAIQASKFKITEVVSGTANGVDKLGERYAKDNKIKVKRFKPDWKNISHPEARVKENRYGKYDASAGMRRNTEMRQYAEALIAIDTKTPGVSNMIKQAKEAELKVFVYDPEDNRQCEYVF